MGGLIVMYSWRTAIGIIKKVSARTRASLMIRYDFFFFNHLVSESALGHYRRGYLGARSIASLNLGLT